MSIVKCKEVSNKYKCGHVWTTQFTRGASERELRALRDSAARKPCPRCEDSTDGKEV